MSGVVFAETLRRHLSSPGYVACLLLLAMLGLFSSSFRNAAAMWPSVIWLLAVVTGSALIGPEFGTGTLQLIVSKPLRRPVYLISRVAGVLAAVALATLVPFVVETSVRALTGGSAWPRMSAALVNSIAASLLAVALLVLIGSLTRSYYNVAIFFGLQIALTVAQSVTGLARVRGAALGRFLESTPQIERSLVLIERTLFPEMPPAIDVAWLARVTLVAAIAIALACAVFDRREVPYGAE